MSIAAKCECGKSPSFCIGGKGCKWETPNRVPVYTVEYVNEMRDRFVTTLKVLRTMMAKGNMPHGVDKCDELIKYYSNE